MRSQTLKEDEQVYYFPRENSLSRDETRLIVKLIATWLE